MLNKLTLIETKLYPKTRAVVRHDFRSQIQKVGSSIGAWKSAPSLFCL